LKQIAQSNPVSSWMVMAAAHKPARMEYLLMIHSSKPARANSATLHRSLVDARMRLFEENRRKTRTHQTETATTATTATAAAKTETTALLGRPTTVLCCCLPPGFLLQPKHLLYGLAPLGISAHRHASLCHDSCAPDLQRVD